jgi:hypothetical protein
VDLDESESQTESSEKNPESRADESFLWKRESVLREFVDDAFDDEEAKDGFGDRISDYEPWNDVIVWKL